MRRELAFRGFTRVNVEALALLAVPGLGPDDVKISSPVPGMVSVGLRGASTLDVSSVAAILDQHLPFGVALDVRAIEAGT